jgi:hypothetical protein
MGLACMLHPPFASGPASKNAGLAGIRLICLNVGVSYLIDPNRHSNDLVMLSNSEPENVSRAKQLD